MIVVYVTLPYCGIYPEENILINIVITSSSGKHVSKDVSNFTSTVPSCSPQCLMISVLTCRWTWCVFKLLCTFKFLIQWFTGFEPTSSACHFFSWPPLLITKEINGGFSVYWTPLSNGPHSPLIGLNSPRGLNRSESHLENLMLLHTYLRLHKARQNVVRQRLIGS